MFDEKCIKSDVCGMAVCDGTRDCRHAVTKCMVEKFTSTNNARDEILRLLDQTDKRLSAGHVVHVGRLLDKIRAKLSPIA